MEFKKICSRCKIAKSPDKFSTDNSKKDGKNKYCRHCRSILYAGYRERNPDISKNASRRWRLNNPERNKARMEKWQDENQDHLKEYRKKYGKKNSARIAKRVTKWQKENPEKVEECRKIYYAKNRKEIIRKVRLWQKKQKMKCN